MKLTTNGLKQAKDLVEIKLLNNSIKSKFQAYFHPKLFVGLNHGKSN